ncbi:MAG TPA: betaine/proline/choline family ABC transporter ATP-binding protein [Bacillota bacterium]|nr:betaine/proline/choline family ABC transporter ATP-binding protein [Bacillota bacterium]
MIEFQNVMKAYDDTSVVIKDLNLHVQKGELLTLIGPSGCGKTTTMRMINRLIEPTKGTIRIDGQDISTLDPVELRRNTGYVIQEIGLFPHMTIEQNISLVPRLKKEDPKKYTQRADELLNLVGLDPEIYKSRVPKELSGGQQQRIGVIRALAANPDIILMDEPFSALDPISRVQLQDDMISLQEEIQKTIVFVTHDMDEAIKIADRIAIMKDGEIIQLDTPENILRHPKNDFVEGFIGKKRLDANKLMLSAKDMLQTEVICVPSDNTLLEAKETMQREKVDHLFVVAKDNTFLGMTTFHDIQRHSNDTSLTVSDVMNTESFKTAHPDDSVIDMAKMFKNTMIHAIPVTEDNRLLGIVTRSSLIHGLANMDEGGDDKWN